MTKQCTYSITKVIKEISICSPIPLVFLNIVIVFLVFTLGLLSVVLSKVLVSAGIPGEEGAISIP